MATLTIVTQIISGIAFLGYGFASLFFGAMKMEFRRYRLEAFRPVVGLLEVLGGLGLLMGFYFEPFTGIAAAGLTTLMAMGIIVRWRLKDTWLQIAPAAVLGGMTGFLFLQAV